MIQIWTYSNHYQVCFRMSVIQLDSLLEILVKTHSKEWATNFPVASTLFSIKYLSEVILDNDV